MPNQKIRRIIDIPDKLYDLITLPDSNDYITFRDTKWYPQYGGEEYNSIKWPDELFGANENDIIRINIYGNNDNLLKTEYLTFDQFESYGSTPDGYGDSAIVTLEPGGILRNLGFRRGRFNMSLDFFRLQAGSPFPLLVNGDEKIYKGAFTSGSDGYLYSGGDHGPSGTSEGDRLYVKENKFILQQISSDRTEIIVSPSFINDESYLENFRMAGFNCLNQFPNRNADGSLVTATFEGPESNFIVLDSDTNLPKEYVNGTIRINNAYFGGKRVTEEIRGLYNVTPEIEIEDAKPNLIESRNLDSLVGWQPHSVWPSPEAVISDGQEPLNKAVYSQPIAGDEGKNPVGNTAIKLTVQNTLNFNDTYLTQRNTSESSLTSVNYSFLLHPEYKLNVDIEAVTMNATMWVKVPAGWRHTIQVHSGPWGIPGNPNTSQAPYTISTGEWTRLTLVFLLTQTSENKIQLRLKVDPTTGPNAIDPSHPNAIGASWYCAGATIQLGAAPTKFMRQNDYEAGIVEVPLNNTIKFADPEGKELHVDFSDIESGFRQDMVGGILKINDAIAIDDLSQVSEVRDADVDTIFDPLIVAAEGEEGTPGGLIKDWDINLHGQAIQVANQHGDTYFTDGYNSEGGSGGRYSKSGTAAAGYHAHWVLDKGINGNPCMYFPDLNYQEYILEDMKTLAESAWTNPEVSYYYKSGPEQQIPDPRLSSLDEADFGKRKQVIATWAEDGPGRAMIGTLASFGVMPGDTLRVSWMQKSKPTTYSQGGRKGASVGIHHSLKRFLDPPTDFVSVTDDLILDSDASVYNWWNSSPGKGFDASGDSWDEDNYMYDPDLVIEGEYVNRIPSEPPAEYSPAGQPPPLPPRQAPQQAGQMSHDSNQLWQADLNPTPLVDPNESVDDQENFPPNNSTNTSPAPTYSWKLDEGKASEKFPDWNWNGESWVRSADTSAKGAMSPGYITDFTQAEVNYIETLAFGWVWNGSKWESLYTKKLSDWKFSNVFDNGGEFIDYETNLASPNFAESNKRRTNGSYRYVDNSGRLTPIIAHPGFATLPISGVTISDDANWIWVADSYSDGHWEFNNSGDSIETTASGRRYYSKRTLDLSLDGSVPGRAYVDTKCEDYNTWEQASFSFEVSPQWDLTDSIQIFVYGHYGDYGTLLVDQLKLEVVTTSNMRVEVDDTATLAPLELTINEVVSSNVVRVTEKYDDAAAAQGNILSNYKVNKYSTFDTGFEIDYVEVPETVEDIFLRYEGKILDVLNDGNHKKIIVDKTYNAYGMEVNAITNAGSSVNPMTVFEDYFVRYRLKDPDNLYTYIVAGDDTKSLIINFKPVNSQEYPGSIAYKLMEPLDADIEVLDMVYIANEVTPTLEETVELIPFIDEKIPDTVLRLPKFQDLDSPIRDRSTEYLSHTDLVGSGSDVRNQLEDRLLSGSLENVSINVDYSQYENFSHFGSVEQRFKNFKVKLQNIETYTQNSASLTGNWSGSGYLGNALTSSVASSSVDIAKWELMKRQVINGFDDFENYMYFQSSSYITSSNGEFFDNTPPKSAGNGTLTNPYVLYPVTSSEFISWYDGSIASASLYDRKNTNRLVNNIPEHVIYDQENAQFVLFMDMMGHHYDHIWSHIRALTDVHDRSEDVTKGISQALVEPVAKSLGFDMKEGRDLVRLPQYHLGLQESGSGTGVYNVRYTKRSQKDLTREIWNRILATMPYLLKAKGTKQSLKALIAAYGIPTSILRVQEYGGPKIGGKPDFEIKQRFTKAVDFKGGQYIKAPWYYTTNGRAPDTIEFRFKSKEEVNQILLDKRNNTNKTEAMLYITNVSGVDTKGDVKFVLSGSTNISMSIANQPVYNGEYWSLMVRRRKDSISGSYEAQTVTSDTNPTTQSFDMFLGYYDAGIDEVIVKASSSMDVSGSLVANWYQTSSVAGDHKWYIGGKADDASKGTQFSGSLMEYRYWGTPLSESAFWNHVSAPKAVNGNHESSSYYDMSLRFSMDDNVNLNTSPYAIKDYSLTDGQLYATASSFNNEINFSNVSDRQKGFMPNIGFGKSSNKLRIEDAVLKTPDGAPAVLSPTERVEVSAYDLAGNDSNKLGIFFAPTDVINEDIILSVADLDYGKYLGDPRDMYEDRYTYGRFDRLADTYWKKWTTKQGFWDYIKLIKYYDLSLFDHLRKLSPGRAKKNVGLLFEPTLLERTKVVMGAPPMMEDLKKSGSLDLQDFGEPLTSSRDYRRGILSDLTADPTSSNLFMRSGSHSPIPDNILTGSFDRKRGILDAKQAITSSNQLFRSSSMEVTHTGSWISSRVDYETKVIDAAFEPETLRQFGLDYRLDFDKRDYVTASVYSGGGESGGSVFFEVTPPMVTGSRVARHNEQYTYYYSSKENASLGLASSSSLGPSEFESVYDSHTGLFNLAYAGCKEDGSTVPFGNDLAVEIIETNPYNVTTKTSGDSYVDVDLNSE